MAEQFAHVIRTTATAPTGTAHVDAIADALMGIGTHWLWMNSEPGKALFECISTGAQLVLHGTPTNIQVGYAPDGGVVDWSGVPTAPVFTGMRNITGAATNFAAGVTATVDIAEYEDALLFAVGYSVAGWRYAALAGRAVKPVDLSDIGRNIGVDALYVGIPSAVASAGNWLYSTTTANVGSCVRTGDAFSPLATLPGFIWTPGTAAGDRVLARVGDVERFPPYQMHILGASGVSQYVGASKYIRQWRALVSHGTRLFSQTAGSEQAWHGHQYDAANRNQFLLWAKTETTV